MLKKLCGDKIYTIYPLLSKEECKDMIQISEKKGFKNSPPSGGGHGRTGQETPRTSQFCVIDKSDMAKLLWEKTKNYIPKDLTHIDKMAYVPNEEAAKKWYPIGVNPHLRFYKYEPGQRIPKHMDYRMSRTVWRNKKKYQQMTFMTLLVYLNDDFEKGETGFWLDFDTDKHGSDVNRKRFCNFVTECGGDCDDHDILVKPQAGKALINDHCLFHEGVAPSNGVKYVLRTDIIHEKEIDIHPAVKSTLTEKDMADTEGDWDRIFETSCKNYAD